MKQQIKLIQSPYAVESRIWSNDNNKLTIAIPNSLIRYADAVCDGVLTYNKLYNAYELTPTHYKCSGYKIYYQVPSMNIKLLPVKIYQGDHICYAETIKLGGLKEIRGFRFWIKKDGEIVDPMPFIAGQTVDLKKELTNKTVSSTIKPTENKIPKKNNKKKKPK